MNRMIALYICLGMIQLSPKVAMSQGLINTCTERSVDADRYFRINYSNDYFTATDFYLTQAFQFEMVLPAFSHIPVYKLMYQPQRNENKYGISIEHNAYTPIHYQRYEIQYGDRPFAAAFFLNVFAISNDVARQQRISTRLSVGAIGPAAFGNAMQTYIHEKTNNTPPHGWHNQIKNDIVLNYEINYQKQLLAVSEYISLSADALARLGTLSTKANVGLTLMSGRFKNPFASIHLKGRTLQFYAYDHPEINMVGYDASLQGGVFNHSSDYTIAASDVSRFVFRNNWGFVMKLGKVYLEYYQSYMTPEFKGGMDFHNGGIQIGYSF